MPSHRYLQETISAYRVQRSNYLGNQTTLLTQRYKDYRVTYGTAGKPYKSLSAADKSKPAPYYLRLENTDNGRYKETNYQYGPGSYYAYYEVNGPDNSVAPETLWDRETVERASYLALKKLLDRMKGEGANLANSLGERKQIASTVERAVLTIYHTMKDLRRGRIESAVRRMGGDPRTARKLRKKDITDQWLSLQYGWKPLLSDVYDVITEAHKREKNIPKTFRAKDVAGSEKPVPIQRLAKNGWNASSNINTLTKFVYTIRAFPDAALIEPAALGITNPLTVAWEVTPWSFVVDWFYPIGTYLEQLSAAHGWNFVDGSTSVLTKCKVMDSGSYLKEQSGPGWFSVNTASYFRNSSLVLFERKVLVAFPTPKPPRLKDPIGVEHVLNSIALLTQVFTKGKVHR